MSKTIPGSANIGRMKGPKLTVEDLKLVQLYKIEKKNSTWMSGKTGTLKGLQGLTLELLTLEDLTLVAQTLL